MDSEMQSTNASPMTKLPEELLVEIAKSFCLHCHHKGPLDAIDLDTSDAYENQEALSNLCRANKQFARVFQPYLYHYYCNRRDYKGYSPLISRANPNRSPETMIPFARTLLRRPDLCKRVEILWLYPREAPYLSREVRQDLQWMFSEGKRQQGFIAPLPGESSALNTRSRLSVQILMVAAVRQSLRYLLYADNGCGHLDRLDEWLNVERLPKLEVATFIAPETDLDGEYQLYDYHLFERCSLIHIAPNLTTLHAADCGGFSVSDQPALGHYLNNINHLRLTNIRRLSLNGLQSPDLDIVLRSTPNLQDFELHLEAQSCFVHPDALKPVRSTLLRLVFSISNHNLLPPALEDFDRRPETSIEHLLDEFFGPTNNQTGLSFRQFTNLQILQVDEAVILGQHLTLPPEQIDWGQLKSHVPESIRILHVGFVLSWPHLLHNLLHITKKKATGRFPQLHTVQVDIIDDHMPEVAEEEVDAVREAMEAVGVKFITGQTTLGPCCRGLLPGRPGGENQWRREGTIYALKDLQ